MSKNRPSNPKFNNQNRQKNKRKAQNSYKNGAKSTPETSDVVSFRLLEIVGLSLLTVSVFLFLALGSYNFKDPSLNNATPSLQINNYAGLFGAYLSDFLLTTFGAIIFVLPVLLLMYAVECIMHKKIKTVHEKFMTLPFFVIAGAVMFERFNPIAGYPNEYYSHNGGMLGVFIYQKLSLMIGVIGTTFLCFMVMLVCSLALTNFSTHDVARGLNCLKRIVLRFMKYTAIKFLQFVKHLKQRKVTSPAKITRAFKEPSNSFNQTKMVENKKKITLKIENNSSSNHKHEDKQEALPLSLEEGYELPPLNLLASNKKVYKELSENELNQNARMIEDQLRNFGVEGSVTKVCPGPVITIYELEPAIGVKTAQVLNLAEDLARAMSAVSIRIAPIPGRTVIGIELPNEQRRMLTLKQMLSTPEFEKHKGKLAVSLGVDTAGNPVYTDLAKTPHCLVAGTTGSGKSVGVNAMILSLLYRMTPKQLKFIMVDPKMLELSVYNDIPHMLAPVVTDPAKASQALKWAVKEMEDRYRKMSEMGVKNISSFNEKFEKLESEGKIPSMQIQTGFDPHTGKPIMEEKPIATETMPYIVVIIDELADLMLVAGKEVEGSIARIAQMARAAGIHLVIATQRPSVDVITGLIKANIPSRMSYKVTSKIDSRTVLDQMGAEKLLGMGDMLFMENGAPNLQRVHGAFADEDECLDVAAFLRQQAKPSYVQAVTSENSGGATEFANSSGGANGNTNQNDPVYQSAIELIAREQKASTSFLQRSLRIGYNKAATIMDQLEADGLVGPASATGKREIIIQTPPSDGY
ncbi:MAG TPA: cell division protein FtsK [Alphaproteobacteria bacterium]|nr:cell division protein FtsK [Alphaproteobacteria bacterium]